jgi:2-C-methyl-D-erythritol 4-phosphate cytidylyltransferase
MSQLFGLIPAAGSGSRMGGSLPKQYHPLAGKPLLWHAVENLCAHHAIEQVFVVLAPGDVHFAACDWRPFGVRVKPLYCGGHTRAASVFNGLLAIRDIVNASDWVLVHDAARPCLPAPALERLIGELRSDESGGLLALPVVDTLKRADRDGYVAQTEPREHLWQAQTPQMFRYRLLVEALRLADLADATDEARAVERLGCRAKLVMGDSRNLKVTYAEDLALAALILENLRREEVDAAAHAKGS